jgi:hypothetical protein
LEFGRRQVNVNDEETFDQVKSAGVLGHCGIADFALRYRQPSDIDRPEYRDQSEPHIGSTSCHDVGELAGSCYLIAPPPSRGVRAVQDTPEDPCASSTRMPASAPQATLAGLVWYDESRR